MGGSADQYVDRSIIIVRRSGLDRRFFERKRLSDGPAKSSQWRNALIYDLRHRLAAV
jgi:hypothetical protein